MYPLTEKSRSDSHGEIATKRRIDVSLIDELDVTPEDSEGSFTVCPGSDPVREKLCALRYTYGISKPVRFFEPGESSN